VLGVQLPTHVRDKRASMVIAGDLQESARCFGLLKRPMQFVACQLLSQDAKGKEARAIGVGIG
jgi:hypothetical protein